MVSSVPPYLEFNFKYQFFHNSIQAFDRIHDIENILKLGSALNQESRFRLMNEIDYILDVLECCDGD